jgi:hypothetical protein
MAPSARKPARTPELTFKARVENFWRWYAEAAPRLYQTIEDKNSACLNTEVSAKVDELIPGSAWVFGPGPNGVGHSFTLSGEGNLHRQFLTEYWHKRAPSLSGWTFYSARQPSDNLKSWRLEIGGDTFDPLEFWLSPTLDSDREKIDLTVWHPLFAKLPEGDRWTVLFLVLDEALGEFGTQSWIGEITMSDQHLADALPLKELPTFVQSTEKETGWEKRAPTETWTGYHIEETHNRFRRGDIIAGTTCNIALVDDFLESEDHLEDPLAGTGADYVFVQFPSAILPQGQQVEARGQIEDALQEALSSAASGRHLGGALGARFAYIELLLFDGAQSLDLVKKVLQAHNLPNGTSIEFFADIKRGNRIVINQI